MLEAHIAFEMTAWTDDVTENLRAEVEAVLEWLDTVSLGSVLSEGDVAAILAEITAPDLTTSALALHERALRDDTPVSELIDREDFDRLTASLAQMSDLQETIVDQVTTSEVYADLISHVLFHGIRNYVIVESPIAKVPGASSLMRMGQNAFDAAAPNLSKGIERQLTAFVASNLQDSLRESRNYLTTVVDEQALSDIAAEVWERNAGETVADLAALVPEDTVITAVEVGADALDHVAESQTVRGLVRALLDANASRSVGEVLAEAGVTADGVVAMVRPWILRAADDGLLEERIRGRLTAFYLYYEG